MDLEIIDEVVSVLDEVRELALALVEQKRIEDDGFITVYETSLGWV